MVSIHVLGLFIGALAVVYALPGPDMALVLQASAGRGFRQGVAVAGGLATARAGHVTLSALGVAALLRSAPWLYNGVRIAGGLYLAYVAVQILRAPAFGMEVRAREGAGPSLSNAYAKGVLGNLLNPKALLFCSVLLPQFVDPAAGAVWSQVMELGVVLVVVGAAFDLTLAAGATRLSRWLTRHPRMQQVQRWTFSATLLAFAARLSLD
ncbi:LysE family translocator [Caballeronia sp. LZ025]|uniref:LysE family translocator n=1 Tax=Caballeronia TaxID=1827195 RepID=UPI001FD53020|nr:MULTISPECIES: LysE family translocator [Caballeronia]MDR5733428.1 LysE family translocator [Caballeronia sp. LZ025]